MSASASESCQSPDLQELCELLSRQWDGELSGEENQRLAVLETVYPDAASTFRRQTRLLSGRLKQIPVRSVERLLFEMPLVAPQAIVVPDSLSSPRRSGSQRIVVGAVTSLLCAGLLFALTRKTEMTDTQLLAEAEVLHSPTEPRAEFGGAGGGVPMLADVPPSDNSFQMKIAEDVPPDTLMGAALSGESASAAGAIPEISSEADVQPLIQSDDWNVVVVRIDAKDRDETMDQIQSIAKKAGLHLKGTAGPVNSRWLGVVLASNVTGREEVVNAMEGVGDSRGYVTDILPVDSPEAMFIEAARESLKHPTRSELYHGKIVVALPSPLENDKETAVVAAAEETASGSSDSATAGQSARPAVVADAAVENRAARSAKVSAEVVRDVTLVVFEFSDSEKSGPNSPGQQI